MNSGISLEQFDALRNSVITMATESWRLFKLKIVMLRFGVLCLVFYLC